MMDLVGYSKLPMGEQVVIIGELTDIVRACPEFVRADAASAIVSLPTGDGMALVFFDDPQAPIRCALEVARATADRDDIELRQGVHSGPVYRVEDINANMNVSGGGINLSQRVMDAGDDGHILVSSTAQELLGQIHQEWDLRPLGDVEVKHGVKMRLFNLVADDGGNPEIPSKVAAAGAPPAPEPAAPTQAPPQRAQPAARPAKPIAPTEKLALPPGFEWVGNEPASHCPHHDPEAYSKWVKTDQPITIRTEKGALPSIWVPGGTLTMGSIRGRPDEKPVTKVPLKGFWLGKAPITVMQYQRVMDAVPPQHNDQGPQHPVVGVTWVEAREFCKRSGLTLPPEAYWEWATRGWESLVYPWGNRWDASNCQCQENLHGHERTAPAGAPALKGGQSWCGAQDLIGNVWEWCADWYHPTLEKSGKEQSTHKSLRGGSWASGADECRGSCRFGSPPNNRRPLIGFRVARPGV